MFAFALHSDAQQDPQFSQYIFNNLSFNPGSAGSKQAICATALHRSQWVGFEDAPVSTNFAVQSPLSLLHGGVGLNILTDKIGQNKFLSLNLLNNNYYNLKTSFTDGLVLVTFDIVKLEDGVNQVAEISNLLEKNVSNLSIFSSSLITLSA